MRSLRGHAAAESSRRSVCVAAKEQVISDKHRLSTSPALPQSICWCCGVCSPSEAPQKEMEKPSQANKSIRIFDANWIPSARELQRLMEHVSFFLFWDWMEMIKVPPAVWIRLSYLSKATYASHVEDKSSQTCWKYHTVMDQNQTVLILIWQQTVERSRSAAVPNITNRGHLTYINSTLTENSCKYILVQQLLV